MRKGIALAVFAGIGVLVLGGPLRRAYPAAMACLIAAVVFIFLPVA